MYLTTVHLDMKKVFQYKVDVNYSVFKKTKLLIYNEYNWWFSRWYCHQIFEDEDGYYDEYLDGYEDEEVDIPDVVSPIAQIPQTTAKRIKSVFSDQQHELLKSKIPILYKDCPLLNPVDRDQVPKILSHSHWNDCVYWDFEVHHWTT